MPGIRTLFRPSRLQNLELLQLLKTDLLLNSAVGTSCQSLQAGYYVCVGVSGRTTTTTTQSTTLSTTTTTSATVTGPTPQQTGIVANCNKYHLVESGDGCASIANTYGILLSNFYAWNPAVGTSCGSLWLGYYVCVGTTCQYTPFCLEHTRAV